MPTHFDVSPAHQALAIYDDPSATGNLDVLANPAAHLAAIRLHSSLEYPKILSITTGTLSFPSIAADNRRLVTTTLFSHGRTGGIPWVFGRAQLGGVWVSLAGTLVLQADSVGRFPRTLALGADGTNVMVHENGIAHHIGTMAALSVPYAVYLTDVLL